MSSYADGLAHGKRKGEEPSFVLDPPMVTAIAVPVREDFFALCKKVRDFGKIPVESNPTALRKAIKDVMDTVHSLENFKTLLERMLVKTNSDRLTYINKLKCNDIPDIKTKIEKLLGYPWSRDVNFDSLPRKRKRFKDYNQGIEEISRVEIESDPTLSKEANKKRAEDLRMMMLMHYKDEYEPINEASFSEFLRPLLVEYYQSISCLRELQLHECVL